MVLTKRTLWVIHLLHPRGLLGGHGAVVEMMAEREDVDPSKAGEDSPAPLLLAPCDGQEVVVKLLLGWDDVNPNK